MNKFSNKPTIIFPEDFQTNIRGSNDDEYQLYLAFANDGEGGDLTNPGQPIKSYDEWLYS